MPLHEYQCGHCGRFEIIQKFSDSPLTVCPKCGGEVHKLLSAPAIHFKGTGWYVTDYARKGAGGSGDGAGKDASSTKDTGGAGGAGKDASSIKDTGGSGDRAGKDTSSTPTKDRSKDSSATGSSPTTK